MDTHSINPLHSATYGTMMITESEEINEAADDVAETVVELQDLIFDGLLDSWDDALDLITKAKDELDTLRSAIMRRYDSD
jgi:hypothetical protein